MDGYEIKLILYSSVETWRQIIVPENITFKQLHRVIQKLFNFDDYHMWDFKVPEKIPGEEAVDLADIKRTITSDEAESCKISEVFDDDKILLYVYDYGDNWEIIVYVTDKVEYNNKTALITDYDGKYSPADDIGGIMVFEEIMENFEDAEYVLGSYGMTLDDLNDMDFEKKYKKGSRIKIS